mgnify:CR=1 FL=1
MILGWEVVNALFSLALKMFTYQDNRWCYMDEIRCRFLDNMSHPQMEEDYCKSACVFAVRCHMTGCSCPSFPTVTNLHQFLLNKGENMYKFRE